ncbi:hypothetical protein RhiirA5_507667 [Rhizophagus irregularis]|uniref:Uncharacterized protein n=1 Tax=Rhizophagus irregularis TaxID=588596 RepID=A0A2N0NI49_9GLOM|nr:hypothetical protein RhiirA5_507667 [Rhizophagus irregularis]
MINNLKISKSVFCFPKLLVNMMFAFHAFFSKNFKNITIPHEGLAAQFFTRRDIEVQRNILQNNFGLTDEDINSWGPRAFCYQMTPENQTINELIEKATDKMISIDQPIVDPMKMIKSGINLDNSPNVDQSSKMEIVTDTPVMKQIENTPLLQTVPQSQNIITDSTKSSNKKKKLNKHLVQQAITGHIPTNEDTLRVRDILVYDILVSWTPEEILKQLTLWEKTISMQMK